MTTENAPVPQTNRQRSLLAVIMLGVLLVAAAIAWYLVRVRTLNPERAGAAVIADLGAQGLDKYWRKQNDRLFYISRDEQRRLTGWLVVVHSPADGGYAGWRQDSAGNREAWKLNNSAAQGVYEGPTTAHGSSITRITLKDSQLTAELLAMDGASLTKTPPTPAPANYIPEGTLPLVAYMVIEKGQEASFVTIQNEEAMVKGQLNFCAVRMRPKGRMTEMETQTYKGLILTKYFADDKGRISGIAQGQAVLQMVSGDELLRLFPDDRRLKGLAEERDVPSAVE